MQDFFTKQHQENRGDTEFLALIKIDQIDVKDVSTDVKEEEFKPNYTGTFCIKFRETKIMCVKCHVSFLGLVTAREREMGRERGGETDRQTDRQTDRDRETERDNF